MSYILNEKIQALTPYHPLEGNSRIRLDANESFRNAPERLTRKIAAEIANLPFHRYPDPFASEVCRSFAELYQLDPSLVTAGNGSDELIFIISVAFLQKGEAMMTLSPDFSMYRFYSGLNESRRVDFRKNSDFTIDIDKVIRDANDNNVRLLIFSNPCNPTSKGLERDAVRRLLRSVNALVVLDEAYMDFWDQSLLSEVAEYDNLIILKTCSKAIGMAGIRLGFAVANSRLTNALKMVKSPYNVNAVTQTIGSVVLREKELLKDSLSQILASKKQLETALKSLETEFPGRFAVIDGVTNFVLLRLKDAAELRASLRKEGISVSGFEDCLRITAGLPEENEEFVRVFRTLL